MRISDWSSDVCSSDLPRIHEPGKKTRHDGGISHIVDYHFVEGEQARLICQIGYDRRNGIAVFRLPRLPQAVMHLYHELMKVNAALAADIKIGRASCRERVGQYVSISVVAGSLKKKN